MFNVSWETIKDFVSKRKIPLLGVEEDECYNLAAVEGAFTLTSKIIKTDPKNAEQQEFEDDYLDKLNIGVIEKVTPSAPSNDFEMKPYGLIYANIDSSDDLIYEITLSNKNDNEYSYSGSEQPKEYDTICAENCKYFDEVEEVDVANSKLTTFKSIIPNGTHELLRPHVIDFQIPTTHELWQLWGVWVHAKDFGERDHVSFQVVDIDNILGLGSDFVLKEYDEMWCECIAKTTGPVLTPDGAPGEIPGGVYVRMLYYATDISKTNIRFYGDLILTIKS